MVLQSTRKNPIRNDNTGDRLTHSGYKCHLYSYQKGDQSKNPHPDRTPVSDEMLGSVFHLCKEPGRLAETKSG